MMEEATQGDEEQQEEQEEEEASLSLSSFPPSQPCLFNDPTIPSFIRYGLPFLLCIDAALLLYSNLTVGAAVNITIHIGKDGSAMVPSEIYGLTLYNVTLRNTVRDFWNAKAYFMSVAIAVLSGAWPHVKILATLVCWFTPPSHLPHTYRRAALFWAYVLQKYSHVETFVLVIMMAAFSMYMSPARYPTWNVRTYVDPQPGFFCFLLGLVLSMVISRIALHYHSMTAREEGPIAMPTTTTTSRRHQLLLGAKGAKEPLLPPPRRPFVLDPSSAWMDILICYLLLGTLALFLAAIWVPAYTFDIRGLAGWLMAEIFHENHIRTSSVVSLGMDITSVSEASSSSSSSSSSSPPQVDLIIIQAAYLFFSIVAPALCMACLAACLMIPRRLAGRLLVVCEVLYAWSAPDVLVVSLVASMVEIVNFVKFVIGSHCDAIDEILRRFIDKELHGDDECLDIKTYLKTGCWLMGAASVLFFTVGYAAMALIRRRAQEAGGRTGAPAAGRRPHDDDDDTDWRVPSPKHVIGLNGDEEESKWPSTMARISAPHGEVMEEGDSRSGEAGGPFTGPLLPFRDNDEGSSSRRRSQ